MLTSNQCTTIAGSISGGSCISGNSLCTTPPQCLPPVDTCSGSVCTDSSCSGTCQQCSVTSYNEVRSSGMTNELCYQICVNKYGFTYAATNVG